MVRKLFFAGIIFSVVISACAPLGGTLEVGIISETQEVSIAITPSLSPPTQTPEPIPDTGIVMGKICFPSEFIPSMTAYFQNDGSGVITTMHIAENQTSYTFELESGEYLVYAYPEEESISLGGMYSAAVACGLTADCSDHTPLIFVILPGETTASIDICDWYAQDQVPLPPGEITQAGPYQNIAGLVYTDIPADETWWIDSNGFPQLLYPERDAKPSPAGDRVLLDRDDSIWVVDLFTGEEINLTADSNRLEGGSQWWPANPEVIVFNSVDMADGWGMSYGPVSIISEDGSSYQVLEESSSFGSPAPSPDGNTIAYDTGYAAWLYRLDTGKEPFNVGEYGLETPEDFKIGSPSWSPDGMKLTWWVGGSFAPSYEWNLGLALFDLDTKDFQFVHRYQPLGGSGGWIPPAQWSPDGGLLALTIRGQGRVPDVMVMRVDGSEAIMLGSGALPLWSPDGSKLVFLRYDPQGSSFIDSQILLVERGIWQPTTVDLPPGSQQIQWGE